ncbi:uncharacterized protein LOC144914741 [Branchiostoma floridae x Branchiostoma belcheri]
MLRIEALVLVLLVSSHLISAISPPLLCPDVCHTSDEYGVGWDKKKGLFCTCPREDIKNVRPCSWIGYEVRVTYPVCLNTIPTDFDRETRSIYIKHLRSATVVERSFLHVPNLHLLKIERSNVSTIQPGAFHGLSSVERLFLNGNRISSLEAYTFLGLKKLEYLYLQRNRISTISHHAFYGLPDIETLRMSQNYLSSVPVEALLPLKQLMIANLHGNVITTIDSKARRLNQIPSLFLMVGLNKLRCDEKLTWFICNLQQLTFVSFRKALKCQSPANLRETSLIERAKSVCQTKHTDGRSSSQEIASEMYNETIPTEDTDTDVPYTNVRTSKIFSVQSFTKMPDVTVHEQTNFKADVVIPVQGNSIPNDEEGWISYFAVITVAFAVPFLILLASLMVVFVLNRRRRKRLPRPNVTPGTNNAESSSPDTGGSHRIEPYAVAYMDSEELRATVRTRNRPSEDDAIQPYAVAYMYANVPGRGGVGKHPPSAGTNGERLQLPPSARARNNASQSGNDHRILQCATTPVDNQDQDDSYETQPYAIGYPDIRLPPSARARNNASRPSNDHRLSQCATLTRRVNNQGQDDSYEIQPYAVGYPDSPPKARSMAETGHSPLEHDHRLSQCVTTRVNNQGQDDSYEIQPYAVGYPDSPPKARNIAETGHSPLEHDHRLSQCATTGVDDQGQDDSNEIQPYAVGYPDSPPADRTMAETGHSQLEHVTN